MKVEFLSYPINSQTPTYGNRDKFIFEKNSDISKGDTANSSKWTFTTNHLGTHIDLPNHFYEDGKKLTDYSADQWIFKKVALIDIPIDSARLITKEDIPKSLDFSIEVLLIRTGYEKYRQEEKYWNDNPGVSPALANFLKLKFNNLKVIGFDFISLTSWKYRDEGKEAHKILLKNEAKREPILIIEDMSLVNIKGNLKQVIVCPLLIEEGDSSPVTVFGFCKK